MIPLLRKIRHRFITEKKAVSYLFYAIGEIILVVIGILIALQINNWNIKSVEAQDEIQQYENIKRQVVDDLSELKKAKELNEYLLAQYETANRIISSKNLNKIDSLAGISMQLSLYSDFYGSGNIYETLVNSGKLDLLKSTKIVSSLQKLEMTYSHLNKLEDIHWEVIISELSPEMRGVINYSNMEVIRPEKLYSVEFQNILIESIYLTKGKAHVYEKAMLEIEQLIEEIVKEIQ